MVKLVLVFLLFSLNLSAQLELIARSGVKESFNIEFGSDFTNEIPVIGPKGNIYLNSLFPTSSSFGLLEFDLKNKSYRKIFSISSEFRISPIQYVDSEHIFYSVYDQEKSYGIFDFNLKHQTRREAFRFPEKETKIISKIFWIDSILSFSSFDRLNSKFAVSKVLGEKDRLELPLLPEDTSYMFTPCSNLAGDLAFKLRVSAQASIAESEKDFLFYRSRDGSTYKILEDHDANAKSTVGKILNQCSLNERGQLAQVVEGLDGKRKLMLLSLMEPPKILVVEGQKDVSELEYFTPQVNNFGEVVFRAKNRDGKRSIQLVDSFGNTKVSIKEGDLVNTDQGLANLAHKNPSFPSFSASPSLSDEGFSFASFLNVIEKNEFLGLGLFYFKIR